MYKYIRTIRVLLYSTRIFAALIATVNALLVHHLLVCHLLKRSRTTYYVRVFVLSSLDFVSLKRFVCSSVWLKTDKAI